MRRLVMAVLLALSVVSCNVSTIDYEQVNSDVLSQVSLGEPDTLIVYTTVDKKMYVDALAMFDTKGEYKGTIPTEHSLFIIAIFLLAMVAFGMGLGMSIKN